MGMLTCGLRAFDHFVGGSFGAGKFDDVDLSSDKKAAAEADKAEQMLRSLGLPVG